MKAQRMQDQADEVYPGRLHELEQRVGHRFVAPLADLRIQQLDLVTAPGQRMAERHERTDVAFTAPGLNADAHA